MRWEKVRRFEDLGSGKYLVEYQLEKFLHTTKKGNGRKGRSYEESES
ncbi:hypothetical protein J7K56_04325 [Candidatus Calescamantes bacterium]|nr:hypothetical protein [Candidatus Calescamantes bacterium]